MQEKLKGFLSKENPSDEELELFLFAMNNQSAALRGVIKKMIGAIEEHVKTVDLWIVPRLQSTKPLPKGTWNEIRNAMRTLEMLQLYLERASDFVGMKVEKAYKEYQEVDVVGHFHWKEKDGQES